MNAIITITSHERHVVQIMGHSTDCLTAYTEPHQRNIALLSLVMGIALLAPCEGNSPVIGELSTQKTSNAEKAFIWWRHHESCLHSMSKSEANLTIMVHNESHESTKATTKQSKTKLVCIFYVVHYEYSAWYTMTPGARPTNGISIEFVIRPKSEMLWFNMYSTDHYEFWRVRNVVFIG